jgi:hypothetical protein
MSVGRSLESIFLPSERQDIGFENFQALASQAPSSRLQHQSRSSPSPPASMMPRLDNMSSPTGDTKFFEAEGRRSPVDDINSTPEYDELDRFQNTLNGVNTTFRLGRTNGGTLTSAASSKTYEGSITFGGDDDLDMSDENDAPQPTPVPAPAQSKGRTGKHPAKNSRIRKSVVSDTDDVPSDSEQVLTNNRRAMRQRTAKQVHPYLNDKLRHLKSQKAGQGHIIDDEEIAEEIQATQGQPKKSKAAGKKRSDSNTSPNSRPRDRNGRFAPIDLSESSINSSRRSSTSAFAAADTPDRSDIASGLTDQQKIERTTLIVCLKDDDESAGAAVPLSDCRSVADLFGQIEETWGVGQVKNVKCFCPWLETNLVMTATMEQTFRHFLHRVTKAPIWQKEGEQELELRVVVTIE